MARGRRDDVAADDAGETQVADDVDNLVADEFVLEMERIQPASIPVGKLNVYAGLRYEFNQMELITNTPAKALAPAEPAYL